MVFSDPEISQDNSGGIWSSGTTELASQSSPGRLDDAHSAGLLSEGMVAEDSHVD